MAALVMRRYAARSVTELAANSAFLRSTSDESILTSLRTRSSSSPGMIEPQCGNCSNPPSERLAKSKP